MRVILYWGIIFLVCVVVRLQYLLGPHVYFDGDEAIVGIMAQDLLDGERFPVYFYGQRYGFAGVEVLATAFFLLFPGNGIMALKLGGLLVFSLGLAFVRKLLDDWRLKPRAAWLVILTLSVFPVWFLWAAKVRGGYVTACMAVCALAYWLGREKMSWKDMVLSAFCLALGMVSHLMIILPFGALIAYTLWKKLRLPRLAVWLLSATVFYVLLRWPAYANEAVWSVSARMELGIDSLKDLFAAFPHIFTGYFYYDHLFPLPPFVLAAFGVHMCAFLVLFCARMVKGGREEKVILALGMSGFLLFGLAVPAVDAKGYRYLIGPLTVFAAMYVFMLYGWISRGNHKRLKVLCILSLFLVPIFSSDRIPAFWQAPDTNDRQALMDLDHRLAEKHISGIFCTDPLLSWQLNYYGNGRYMARYLFRKDRIQKYIEKTDRCHNDPGCKTAIVGIYGNALGMDSLAGWHDSVIYVGERFYIQPDVKPAFLSHARFEMGK